jgi:uncharacterized CHY-type Zn-finger protein
MICGGCGLTIDGEASESLSKCPRCQKPFKDYRDAHISARPEWERQEIPEVTVCPECRSSLVFEEGCMKCSNLSCGWSACG